MRLQTSQASKLHFQLIKCLSPSLNAENYCVPSQLCMLVDTVFVCSADIPPVSNDKNWQKQLNGIAKITFYPPCIQVDFYLMIMTISEEYITFPNSREHLPKLLKVSLLTPSTIFRNQQN